MCSPCPMECNAHCQILKSNYFNNVHVRDFLGFLSCTFVCTFEGDVFSSFPLQVLFFQSRLQKKYFPEGFWEVFFEARTYSCFNFSSFAFVCKANIFYRLRAFKSLTSCFPLIFSWQNRECSLFWLSERNCLWSFIWIWFHCCNNISNIFDFCQSKIILWESVLT